jgi:shikimate kinase
MDNTKLALFPITGNKTKKPITIYSKNQIEDLVKYLEKNSKLFIIIGHAGAGKTTLSEYINKNSKNLEVFSLDKIVKDEFGTSFIRNPTGFRIQEMESFLSLLKYYFSFKKNFGIDCGGGFPFLSSNLIEFIKESVPTFEVVYVIGDKTKEIDKYKRRYKNYIIPDKTLDSFYKSRTSIYGDLATIILNNVTGKENDGE